MYRVVLISSAKHVTDSFNSMDLWEKQGFSLINVVYSADEALKENVDVIICPSVSSFMDSCEFSKTIKKNTPKTKVIMYGRKTYDHVKNAIDSEAYIPMPLDNNEFVNLLTRVKNMLVSDYSISKQTVVESNEKTDLAIYNMICGKCSEKSDIDAIFKNIFDVDSCDELEYQVVRLRIKNFDEYVKNYWKHEKDLLYTAVTNIVRKNDEGLCIYPVNVTETDIYMMLFKYKKQYSDSLFDEVKNNIRVIMNLTVEIDTIGSGDIYSISDEVVRENIVKLVQLSNYYTDSSYEETEKFAITNAKNYINKSYRFEISLNDVAKYVGLSSAYFSRLFKQETGENFIDYLIKVRMENAKTYLRNSQYKTYEVSEMVGYTKSKYFSKMFKNYTGYTPTEYKERMRYKKN